MVRPQAMGAGGKVNARDRTESGAPRQTMSDASAPNEICRVQKKSGAVLTEFRPKADSVSERAKRAEAAGIARRGVFLPLHFEPSRAHCHEIVARLRNLND